MSAHLNGTSAELYFNFDVFAHMTRFFGYKVVLLGLYNGQNLKPSECRTLVRVVPQQQFVKVVLRDHKMVGALLIGDTGKLTNTWTHFGYYYCYSVWIVLCERFM